MFNFNYINMFGQSYMVFKVASGALRIAARACGASESAADKIGAVGGTYIGAWTAIITADPAGGIGIAVDTANQVDKSLKEDEK